MPYILDITDLIYPKAIYRIEAKYNLVAFDKIEGTVNTLLNGLCVWLERGY